MSKGIGDGFPRAFVENALALCGANGADWLEKLPTTVSALEQKWNITAGKHVRDLSFNFVATAKLVSGRPAILKLGLPLEDAEIFGEAEYLRLANGRGVVKLLEFDGEYQAMLLECVRPGVNLKSVCRNDQSEAVAVAIDVLKRVLRPVPRSAGGFIRLDDWFDGLRRALGTDFPRSYAERALVMYSELSADTKNIFLLHGDLHHSNILSADREPFLAIDPKGIIGHVGYDIGVFLNNHYNWLEWNTRLAGKLDRAIAEFASAFEVEAKTIRQWAFCQMVVSCWWMFDEMPGTFGEGLGLSDIWQV
ncbi:MAG TPA: aminoglycoside phosphotransferase family protein [Pyrinomonadaceae bacterium]|nr:aminoglycoside phosphotransferase family protein [Pyrinomonadaceae bacterium]